MNIGKSQRLKYLHRLERVHCDRFSCLVYTLLKGNESLASCTNAIKFKVKMQVDRQSMSENCFSSKNRKYLDKVSDSSTRNSATRVVCSRKIALWASGTRS